MTQSAQTDVFFYKLWRKSFFIFLHSKLLRYSGELLGNSFSKSWYVVQWEFVLVLWNVSNIFRAFVRKFVHLLVESFLSILTPVRFSLKIIVASPYPLKHAVSFAYVNRLILTNSLMRYVLLLSLFKMRKLRHNVNCFAQAFTASAELRSGCTFPVSDPHKKEMWCHDTNEQIRSCKSVQLYSGKKWNFVFWNHITVGEFRNMHHLYETFGTNSICKRLNNLLLNRKTPDCIERRFFFFFFASSITYVLIVFPSLCRNCCEYYSVSRLPFLYCRL